MKKLSIPVGISNFEKIRGNGYYYVDKSRLIFDLLKDEPTEVTLITRPRRFGKTLGMSMLECFFDIRKDSRTIFEGLEIVNEKGICQKWMNQYPTLCLTFKDVDGLTFSSAYEMLSEMISEAYKTHVYLLESDVISSYDKVSMQRIVEGQATVVDIKKSIALLMKLMAIYYAKPVILLIDEYDVPIAKASSHGYYEEMMDIMKALLSTALKDNHSLCFAVITGCLKIAKESIFTGTNNFVSDTIANSGLNEYFGFTQTDVDQRLSDADAGSYAEDIKQWYDGYHFGNFDVYCPWDVMNYLRDIMNNPQATPASYWKNTSDNMIIRSFIDYAGSSITKKLEILLSGGYIVQHIDDNLTYDYLHSSEDNLWSILYLTGYLTKVREDDVSEKISPYNTALMIPNNEIKEIFETTIMKWFNDSVQKWNRKALFSAVWQKDCQKATEEMNRLLRQTISYHVYREDFYHAFLAGIFAGAGYTVESNKEHGEGRSDIVVCDSVNGRVAVFEIKYSNSVDMMAADCDKALAQIDKRMYAKAFEEAYEQVICYGVAFYKKRCLVVSEKRNYTLPEDGSV